MTIDLSLNGIVAVYRGSNGDLTKAFYERLKAQQPPLGEIAVNLFRACKTSERAKAYRRGPGHKTASYERKDWSLKNAARLLAAMDTAPFQWGWRIDETLRRADDPHYHVVYFDLPSGQVSFHTYERVEGPDFPGKWDREYGTAPMRIIEYCFGLFNPGYFEASAGRDDDDDSFADRAVQAEIDRACGVPTDDDWLLP